SKFPSPHSIRQFQKTTITPSIENTGTTDITDIEITDSIHPSFDLISGNFPNPKRYDRIRPGETRDLQYTISAKESGTFMFDHATVTYADKDGNIQEAFSKPSSLKVFPSTGDSTIRSSNPSESDKPSTSGFAAVFAVIGLLAVYLKRKV
ncbi:MAG: PGF-CTERM sorting domain-containing protein, partial [Methanosarcinaceae archaeon]